MSFPLLRKNGRIQIGKYDVQDIIEKYDSPLYIYDEATLREQCRKIKNIVDLPNFRVYYSAKANTNIKLLQIIRSEGLCVDAMSLGELQQEEIAGFTKDEILFLSNNVPPKALEIIIEKELPVCLDSLTQLELYFSLSPKKPAYIRLNIGTAQGHHTKVQTAGKVKFGIPIEQIEDAFTLAKKYKQKITGFMFHNGSLFLDDTIYLNTINDMLALAEQYHDIEYIDFGGGIGIPYNREQQEPFPLDSFSEKLTAKLNAWMAKTKRQPIFAIEPGRFIVAECGIALATVQSVKQNYGVNFIGTDLGFNMLIRPEFYDAYHEIIHTTKEGIFNEPMQIVGNICESGDYLGKDRYLPVTASQDILLIRDTGAYGFAMSSNYNSLLRCAELLVTTQGEIQLIRKRESLDQLLTNQIYS